MAALQPLYTRDNCSFCAPLQWGLTILCREAVTDTPSLAHLGRALELDGVRVLGHHLAEPCVSQFALSSLPSVTPLLLVNRVKGRLQYLIRQSRPKTLQRNHALGSFGSATDIRSLRQRWLREAGPSAADPALFARWLASQREVTD